MRAVFCAIPVIIVAFLFAGCTTPAPGTGNVTVVIGPAGAVLAGAQWTTADTGTWLNGGATAQLAVGTYTIAFKDISGWTKPADQTVVVGDGQTIILTGAYTRIQYLLSTSVMGGHGSLVPATGFQNIGDVVTVTAVPDSGYRVKAWTGTDNDALVTSTNTVTMSGNKVVIVVFEPVTPTGSLMVVIAPEAVVTDGARWNVDGGAAQTSGTVVNGLAVGSHTVSFTEVGGWTKPVAQTVDVTEGQTASLTGTYARIRYMLTTSVIGGHGGLLPATGLQNAGAVVTLAATPEVGYQVKQWIGTDNDALLTNGNSVTMAGDKTVTVEFQPGGATGSLQATLGPQAAVDAGAKWRVDGGTPQVSGATVTGLSVGPHTVSFTGIGGWTTPPDQQVEVLENATTPVTGDYTAVSATSSVTVTLLPAGAVSAGAQWNLDGGTWNSSGFTLTQVTSGPHTLLFKPVAAWIKPVSQNITLTTGQALSQSASYKAQLTSTSMVVFGYNDLGMHCMGNDFSEIMILPPYNNLHAQVIRRGGEPQIVTRGIDVTYAVQGNTHSADKTNFWTYVNALFGVNPAPNVGLTGKGLSGTMSSLAASGRADWDAEGIPITPIDDSGWLNPYPLATITVMQNSQNVVQTQAVVPVSWEMNCNLCHTSAGVSVGTNILQAHDRLHGTKLVNQKPVACGSCHAQPELGWTGNPSLPTLSSAMHGAHAQRMSLVNLTVECYACHPGIMTQCQRDVHFSKGLTCTNCHGNMTAVANPARVPWQTEPRCGQTGCHSRAGFQFEQANTLYRNSRGHNGVNCESCHGSPHAITPTVKDEDNIQAIALQGHAGVINTCTVCHTQTPDESFNHTLSD